MNLPLEGADGFQRDGLMDGAGVAAYRAYVESLPAGISVDAEAIVAERGLTRNAMIDLGWVPVENEDGNEGLSTRRQQWVRVDRDQTT